MDPQPTLSNYARTLNSDVRERYVKKIGSIGNDPYLLLENSSIWNINFNEFPEVTSNDIYNYVVLGTSYYTGDQFKAYKSLQAFQYCDEGFMRNVRFTKIQSGSVSVYLLCGEVLHSQRFGEPPLSPWVIVRSDGTITSGHCTCMAGLGECCSHVGALLFFVEIVCRRRSKPGLTEAAAYWVPPSGCNVADPKPLKEIDFRTTTKKLKGDGVSEIKIAVQEINADSFENFKDDLKTFADGQGMKPSYFRLTTRQEEHPSEKFPMVLNRIFEEDYADLPHEELDVIGHSLDFSLSQSQCDYIELHSRRQANSTEWFKFRAGRVTASVVHSVCKVKAFDSNKSLISKICYPSRSLMNITAVAWGCNHEGVAVSEYTKLISRSHQNLSFSHSGLIIHPDYPYLGASPDLVVSCDCCGKGCLEVKCPHCCTWKSLKDIPYLQGEDGNLSLNPNHPYFYQIQLQIFLSKSKYGDFFVWSPNEPPHYQRLSLEENIINEILLKSSSFFRNSVLPELLGKYFTRMQRDKEDDHAVAGPSSGVENPFCVCNSTKKGKTIVCTQNGCKIIKYHLKCLNMVRMSKSKKWICPYCKSQKN